MRPRMRAAVAALLFVVVGIVLVAVAAGPTSAAVVASLDELRAHVGGVGDADADADAAATTSPPPPPLLVTFSDSHFAPLLLNYVLALERLDAAPRDVLIVALDRATHRTLVRAGLDEVRACVRACVLRSDCSHAHTRDAAARS